MGSLLPHPDRLGLRRCFQGLVTALLLGSTAAATSPILPLTAQFGPPTPGDSAAVQTPPVPPSPIPLSSATFGAARFSTTGSNTRVVFDLPAGLTYTITPTFSGLRIDVQSSAGQTRALAAQHVPSPGGAVSDYTLTPDPSGGGLAFLQTPFPLGGIQGWTATETTIATGGRVLILNLGAALGGGADTSVTGSVQAIANPISAATTPPASPPTAPPRTGTGGTGADQLPPGDTTPPLSSAALPSAPPALAGSADSRRLTVGVVEGSSVGTAALTAPRIGKNPGLTRVVLDLPPGTGFRITPLPLGLRLDLTGVSAQGLASLPNLTPELQAWSFAPNLTGASLTLLTGSPITLRSGWRDVLLPAGAGQLARLAIDLSPALADTSPLGTLALAPLRSAKGPMLAFSGAPGRPKVVIDPGHGGSDPGAIGQVVEKEVTLAVALRVRADLNAAGIDVLMTRDRDTQLAASKVTDLAMRAALGTGVAQMFVSIHVNSTEASSALRGYGIETWWNPNHPNSQALAQNIQQDAVSATAAYSRGLRHNQSLAVLRQSRIPAALVEIGYTSHPVDGQNLADSNYLDRVAFGVASGIRDALQSGLGTSWR